MKIINDSLQVLCGLKKGLPCPVCGRQRSSKDLSHGKCAEEMARRCAEKSRMKNMQKNKVSADDIAKTKSMTSKKKYLKGDLPGFMYS